MTKRKPGPTLAEQFGVILTRQRETLGVSRTALAKRHGYSDKSLRSVELGLDNPTLARVEALARDVYGIDVGLVATSGVLAAVSSRPITRAQ